jgi:phosphate transport system substrate-binding protein
MSNAKITAILNNAILVFFLTSISATAFSEELRIGGGAAPMNNIFLKIQKQFEKATGIKLILKEDGPDVALIQLDQGKLDMATGGVKPDALYELVAKKNYTLKNRDSFKSRVIGRDRIQVYTHSEINVKNLTPSQLKDLFTGKITNWKELNGPDVKVKVILGSKTPGMQKYFQETVMDNQHYAPGDDHFEAGDGGEVQDKIAATPGGIGLGAMTRENKSVGQPSIPVIGRPVYAITVGAPSPAANKLFDFIQNEGAKLIEK